MLTDILRFRAMMAVDQIEAFSAPYRFDRVAREDLVRLLQGRR